MELGYIYFLQSLIWPENQSDEANEAKMMRIGDGWEANSRAKRKQCVLEMAGKPTRYEQALLNIYNQTKTNDRHMMNRIRRVHIYAHIKI